MKKQKSSQNSDYTPAQLDLEEFIQELKQEDKKHKRPQRLPTEH